jgi:RNA polymerase sigma factor (sigma-70 family)
MAAVERAVRRLPGTYRKVIRLRNLEGQSVEETAKRMRRTRGTVEQICNRAYRALRVELRNAAARAEMGNASIYL